MRRSILISAALAALALPVALVAKPAEPAPAPAPAPSASPTMTPEEERAALNAAEAQRAQQQVDENVARELNNQEAARTAVARQRDYQEANSRYEQAKAQYDAQVARYQADLQRWKADVAACLAGDKTRCAKQ